LLELISERSQFTREEQQVIKTNEERLDYLHSLEQQIEHLGENKSEGGKEYNADELGVVESHGVPLRNANLRILSEYSI
jgi:hypothetical protein